jgi:arylsulfatase A-like enzyme
MTGKHPTRVDATNYFSGRRAGRFLPAPLHDNMPLEEVTLAEALKAKGYATFFAGKWHLGGEGFDPTTQGFDVNVAGHHRGGPYGPGKYFHPFGMPNLESKEGDHLPARLAEEACAFIEENKDGPWLCYLSFYSVHTPLMARPDLLEKYERKRADMGLEAEWGQEGDRKVRLVQEHAVYAGMVAAMDEAVGEVLATLDRLDLADNTIVVFFSDNGGLSTSEGHPTSNLPLRGGKGWLYEGGIREPCVVRWPGKISAGATSDVPIQSVDFLPTLAAATGAKLPEGVTLDGVDILPLLVDGEDPERDALFWHYPHHGNQGGFPGGAVLVDGWKWIVRYGATPVGELYRLDDDLEEAHDLAAAEPERAARMSARFDAWCAEVGARMPTVNPLVTPEEGGR